MFSPRSLLGKRSAISWISLHELPLVESQKERLRCASIRLPHLFGSLFDGDFSAELYVKSVLRCWRSCEAHRSRWVPSLVKIISFNEIRSGNMNVFQLSSLHAAEKLEHNMISRWKKIHNSLV